MTATTLDAGPVQPVGPARPVAPDDGAVPAAAAGAVGEREPAPACAPAPVPPAGDTALSIAEVAGRTGVTAHTLRYYERIGLLTVPRDDAGHRLYTEAELARVVFITRLRLTAMPIRDIQAYFRLVADGPGNEDQRLALLERHRDQVKERITELESALGVIEYKITTYGGQCAP
ncbi:MAG TPA: MerR family transcriptional regulator [Acidimicrobiales bacterium]